MIRKRKIVIILSCVLAIGILFSGCGSKDTSSSSTSNVSSNSTTNAVSTLPNSTAADKTENPLWKMVTEAVVKHDNYLIGFLNEKLGITVGVAGEIHYTEDGGKTWPKSVNNSACRWGLDILNENLAWSCGDASNIRVSKDMGKNWNAVADCKGPCKFISFVDDKTGWVANSDWLQATTDSGATWKDITLPKELNTIAAINLISANEGYALNGDGMLYSTKDGGKTWSTPNDVGIKNLKIDNNVIPVTISASAAIRFTDSNNGVIVFNARTGTDGNVWALKTSDGGKTWSTQALNMDKVYSQSSVYLSHDGKYLTLRSESGKFGLFLLKL